MALYNPHGNNSPACITPVVIRLVPQLSVTAIKKKLDKELALWFCLRTINHWGSGHLDILVAVEVLVNEFGYSKSAVYRILSNGHNVFWLKRRVGNSNKLRIEIFGLKKVAKQQNDEN